LDLDSTTVSEEMTAMKIIFDQSAFHNRFDLLKTQTYDLFSSFES
jgi:hypothetical protein